MSRTFVHFLAASVLSILAVSPAALAQAPAGAGPAAFLSKEELKMLVIGKTVNWTREKDYVPFWWAIKEDGSFDTASLEQRGGRGYQDSGKWELHDDGRLCMKFNARGDRPCVSFFFQKKGEKYEIHTSRKPGETRYAEVSSLK